MSPSLGEQITDQLLLLRGARERNQPDKVYAHTKQLNYLLERVPHAGRF